MDTLLQVKNLTVNIEEKEILHNISFNIGKGETHVLMGPNGAGKSTLGYALMGNPKYKITDGSIIFNGMNLTYESADKRSKEGMFLSFQSPYEVEGVSLNSFIRSALKERTKRGIRFQNFTKELSENMKVLNMDSSYGSRDLNVGFSGGEKKKAEILQLLMLKPSFAILDETDSGLDIDAARTVSLGIQEYQKKQHGSLLIITHNTKILESLNVDYTHVIIDGKIVKTDDKSLIDEININGYKEYTND